jgi:hypothetical protein
MILSFFEWQQNVDQIYQQLVYVVIGENSLNTHLLEKENM